MSVPTRGILLKSGEQEGMQQNVSEIQKTTLPQHLRVRNGGKQTHGNTSEMTESSLYMQLF